MGTTFARRVTLHASTALAFVGARDLLRPSLLTARVRGWPSLLTARVRGWPTLLTARLHGGLILLTARLCDGPSLYDGSLPDLILRRQGVCLTIALLL